MNIIIENEIKISEELGRSINVDAIPRRCFKCNCNRFEASVVDQEKCAACGDDEEKHDQVKY